MKQTKVLQILTILIAAVVVFVAAFFLGDKHGVENMSFKQVIPDQLGSAMKDDHFYSSYRENTLLVDGTVASVESSSNNSIASFKTTSSYSVSCDFGRLMPTIRTGDKIIVITEGATAVRQPSGVMLKNCVLP